MGGPTSVYHVALARLKLQKKALDEANESLNQALILNIQVGQVSVLLVWCFVIVLNHIQGGPKITERHTSGNNCK